MIYTIKNTLQMRVKCDETSIAIVNVTYLISIKEYELGLSQARGNCEHQSSIFANYIACMRAHVCMWVCAGV